MKEVGFVKSIQRFLVGIEGLPTIKVNDLVETEDGRIVGYVSTLRPDHVNVMMLSRTSLESGQRVKKSGQRLRVNIGDFLIGRVIDPLGRPMDNRPLPPSKKLEEVGLEQTAPGIKDRDMIDEQLDTGIGVIDTILPLAKGQRELIIGDARAGKTKFLLEVISNQAQAGTLCVYALIGKPLEEVKALIKALKQRNALDHTIVIAAPSSELSPLIFWAPYTALSIAEYFQKKGKDILVILDDLGVHAKIYREMSLLGEKAPGREFYPGDIFFQHAHLVERAGNFSKVLGGGSITALPVMEINLDEFATFIPTNLVAMTDGHLLFDGRLYAQGQFPPIEIDRSVTRVGRQTQSPLQTLLALRVEETLTRASRLETLTRFGGELPAETRLVLKRRDLIKELLNHDLEVFLSEEEQVVLLGLAFTDFLKDKDPSFIKKNKRKLIEGIKKDSQISYLAEKMLTFNNLDNFLKKLNALNERFQKICEP